MSKNLCERCGEEKEFSFDSRVCNECRIELELREWEDYEYERYGEKKEDWAKEVI